MAKRIGDFFVEKGVLTDEQRHQILDYSARSGIRFGEAGVQLGLLTREKLLQLFGPHYSIDLFQIEPEHFPQATRALLSIDDIIRWGALPLGFKSHRRLLRGTEVTLNIGLLNPGPGNSTAVSEITRAARERSQGPIHGAKVFLILADQYLDVLRVVYGVNESELKSRDPAGIDPTLVLFLETAHHSN
jgi:hypothetical protein